MSQSAKQSSGHSFQAEVSLLPSLKNCLVNLPAALVSVLANADAVVQDVIVELSYNIVRSSSADGRDHEKVARKAAFMGWTGMQSKRKTAPELVRSISGKVSSEHGSRDSDTPVIDVDAAFGRLIGLSGGQRVGVALHLHPALVHTVNIEPLTPTDWEIIELHSQFLELNFLSQIRAIPNPSYASSSATEKQIVQALTLHLSPTTTTNVAVTSLKPTLPSTVAFARISPDAEVIIAPKTRPKSGKETNSNSKSVTSTDRKSVGGKSKASTARHNASQLDGLRQSPAFFRPVDRSFARQWFDEENIELDDSFYVWLDQEALLTKRFKGTTFVSVSLVKPSALIKSGESQNQAPSEKPVEKVVARLALWAHAPDSQHVALSSALCGSLGCKGVIGGLVRIEAAPPQILRPSPSWKSVQGDQIASTASASRLSEPLTLNVFPFSVGKSQRAAGFQFGGSSELKQEEPMNLLKALFGGRTPEALLNGPLTDGMVLPSRVKEGRSWNGGLIRFSNQSVNGTASPKWLKGSDLTLSIELQAEIPKPKTLLESLAIGQPLPECSPAMFGVDNIVRQLKSRILHSSSVLLTSGIGAGKSSITHLVAHQLRGEHLYNVTYFPCTTFLTDEARVSTIKDTLNRVFISAAWATQHNGHALVILDDVDKLCPVETELQVGGENGRSRQISESLCSLTKKYCHMNSGIVVLATALSKEAVNNVVIGGHVFKEIINLKAPDKDKRRGMLHMMMHSNEKAVNDGDHLDSPGRMSAGCRDIQLDEGFDLLDIAGQTDGYMPGDLGILISRAKGEALIRAVSRGEQTISDEPISVTKEDFRRALHGFTPVSLRNVNLHSSSMRWDSIGGLHSTRRTLLETLQYPTTYAPIFAQCPLRLRSGLLLYGYPGCGKTLLASAVAGECGLNFISVKGPEMLNKYIGASEKAVRDLFERAEAARPSILFFDEFDSIAPKRGHDSTGVTDRVVNQLLTQMDGAEGLSGVYVLAATSRPDLIDPALLRPGRLDKSLLCDLPTEEDRVEILEALSRSVKMDDTILRTRTGGKTLKEIARRTQGYSGADLHAIVYNAQLEAIHDVLGDSEANLNGASASANTTKTELSRKSSESQAENRFAPEFTYFRIGQSLSTDEFQEPTSSAKVSERAAIASQLQAFQLQHKRQRQLTEHYEPLAKTVRENLENGQPDSNEPIIRWRHLETALSTTRPSIGEAERRRLTGIYQEFVTGRNGEMPNGEGSHEIGGRTSLM